jgi:hypothetical protein
MLGFYDYGRKGSQRWLKCLAEFGTFTFQCCFKPEGDSFPYQIRSASLCDFLDDGRNEVYEYLPSFEYSKDESADRTRQYTLEKTYYGLRSIMGDDFVLECLAGEKVNMILGKMGFGYHITEDRRKIFKYQHHAITIEGGWVVHFAAQKGSGEKPSITLQRLSDLKNPKRMEYTNENLLNRFLARNRALWALVGAVHNKEYNLVTNNCEHFASWCKIGKHESTQVRECVMGAVSYILGALVIGLVNINNEE